MASRRLTPDIACKTGCWLIAFLALFLTQRYSTLLFHTLSELFSVFIAFAIFMFTWNSRRFIDNNYLLFIGIAYLFIGSFDLIHTLAFKGMNIFAGFDANLPTQLWVAARFTESISLLIAPIYFEKPLNIVRVSISYAVIFGLVILSIFHGTLFPDCYIEGSGLTPFKIASEYIIATILLAAIGLLLRHRQRFNRHVFHLMIGSIALTVAAELTFTLYISVFGAPILFGHLLKLASFFLVYRAIIHTGFKTPYKLMFRNLKQSEEKLRKARNELEVRVRERTAELTLANAQLNMEIEERKRVEQALLDSKNELKSLSARLLSAGEQERKRIARELHDGIGQSFSAIKFQAERVLAGNGNPFDGNRAKDLRSIVTLVREAMEEVRRIIQDLRPSLLDDLGILATIGWFCREHQGRHPSVTITRDVKVQENDIPDPIKTAIYRILQEAMNNIAKYSEADQVTVSLARQNGCIRFSIEDNGRGFNRIAPGTSRQPGNGFGMTTMRERAELSGGDFSLSTHPGQGTAIQVKWPVDRAETKN
mgnify:CR=1 FL=1